MARSTRTKQDVLAARRNAVGGGCCDRFADQQACDCLERAEADEPMTRDLTATPEYRAFLASVIAAPDDDAPRLAFADWLEEQGEAARAEFIRVQCELVKMSLECHKTFCDGSLVVCEECKRWKTFRRREREMLSSHWPNWTPPIAERSSIYVLNSSATVRVRQNESYDDDTALFFRRGFIESVRCDWPTWRDHGDAILAACPLREVVLTNSPNPSWSLMAIGVEQWRYCLLDGLTAARRVDFLRHPREARSRIVVEVLRATWPRVKTWRLPE